MESENRKQFVGMFPTTRMRRLRYLPAVRSLVQEVQISPSKLILPLFVCSGTKVRKPIASMPGHAQLSIDQLGDELSEVQALRIGGVMLFGIPSEKDARGSDSMCSDGIIQQALHKAKETAPDVLVISDVCFCEYTDHGQCGIVSETGGYTDVDNDATCELLARQALSHANAGADMVAPSGMIDGMVESIRKGLDQGGYEHLPILSYAAKYASSFYGPFRDAAESIPVAGNRKSHQMDPAVSADQAIREVALDLAEGADMIMIKPALAYLDVIAKVKNQFPGVPLAAYNVSGEYSMVRAAAEQGWIDQRAATLEMLVAMHRAGAQMIVTYAAKDVARWNAE
tara:strand:+ start:643 stop:1665 length:1023 start_codon:yes stop_codon:yes gene_type:complete